MTRALVVLSFSISLSVGGLHAAAVAADSARGAELFETLSCVQCHSINGKGGTAAPDLGRRIDRGFTPASLAATMWNHAPAMWASMRERGIQAGDLNEQAAADLFAYFYSARFFERPGDAGRGKSLFSAKHCSECHGLTEAKLPEAKPVAQWDSIGQPMALVNAMWNHAATMRQEFAKRKLRWPDLSSQDLTDILVYLRDLPSARNGAVRVEITSGAEWPGTIRVEGMRGLPHRQERSGAAAQRENSDRYRRRDVGSRAQNASSPRAARSGRDARDRELSCGLNSSLRTRAAPPPARRVFMAKHCATCHDDGTSGAPKLAGAGRTFTALTMVSALWHHGPQMLDQMKTKGIAWPRFDGPEMANLVAYLNAQNGRK